MLQILVMPMKGSTGPHISQTDLFGTEMISFANDEKLENVFYCRVHHC